MTRSLRPFLLMAPAAALIGVFLLRNGLGLLPRCFFQSHSFPLRWQPAAAGWMMPTRSKSR